MARATDERCNFCGKLKREVDTLIFSPGIYICDECVAECNRLIASRKTRFSPRRRWWQRFANPS